MISRMLLWHHVWPALLTGVTDQQQLDEKVVVWRNHCGSAAIVARLRRDPIEAVRNSERWFERTRLPVCLSTQVEGCRCKDSARDDFAGDEIMGPTPPFLRCQLLTSAAPATHCMDTCVLLPSN